MDDDNVITTIRRIGNWGVVAIATALSLLVLMLAPVLRQSSGKPGFIGGESYHHAFVAGEIIRGAIPLTDGPAGTGSPYLFSLYDLLLAAAGWALGMDAASIALPVILGVLSVLIFMLLLRRFDVSLADQLAFAAFLILSPGFIYLYTVSGSMALFCLLSLLCLYFFIQDGWRSYLSAAFIMLIALTGFYNGMIAMILLSFYAFFQKRLKAWDYLACFVGSVVAFLSVYLGYLISNGFPGRLSIFFAGSFSKIIVGLGAISGFALIMLILSGVGLITTKQAKISYLPFYAGLAALAIFSYFLDSYVPVLNFFVAYLAGLGFLAMVRMHWQLKVVRNLTVLVILIGILSSVYTYTGRLSEFGPSENLSFAMQELRQAELDSIFVLSAPQNGLWIEYLSARPALLRNRMAVGDGTIEAYNDSLAIFASRDAAVTLALLEKHDIGAIVITEDMQPMLIGGNLVGLPFILENSDRFERLAQSGDVSVWKVRQ